MTTPSGTLITCWFDNSDQPAELCIQKRRSARIFSKHGKKLPFPQCLKCKKSMEKKLEVMQSKAFCKGCEKVLPKATVDAGVGYCIECRKNKLNSKRLRDIYIPNEAKKPNVKYCEYCHLRPVIKFKNKCIVNYCDYCRGEVIAIRSAKANKRYREKQALLVKSTNEAGEVRQ